MYVIGLDLSKYKHDCFIATETGETIKETFSFENDLRGFSKFLSILNSLDSSQEKRIGMESTGHYGNNLMRFLKENNYDFMVFNPYLTEKYRQANSLRRTKTDKIDAKIISKMLLSLDYKTYSSKSYHISSLKSLTRFRFSLIESRSKLKMKLQNILDLTFPEFPKFFSDLFGVLPLKILKAYPSASQIASLDPDVSYDELTRGLRGHYNYQKFKNIILSAKNTIGKSNEIKELELSITINLIEDLNEQIERIETEIDSIMSQYSFKTITIPGIGVVSAASIVSEYSDFSLFKNPNQLLAFAGIEPSVSQSGTQSFNGHMVKRGSLHLRYVLMNVAIGVIKYNKVFSNYYYKKETKANAIELR